MGAGEPLDKERSRIYRKACHYIQHTLSRQAMNADTTQSPSATMPREPPLTLQRLPALPAIVLDTNVVLDWLLFGDPSAAELSAAITQRRVRWVATALMRSEFAAVLRRGLAAAHDVDPDAALAAWDIHVDHCDHPQALPDSVALRCTDADDQMFLDLAHAAGARWLVSRDRAVLRLARRAAAHGIAIMAPERWSARP
jgi:predicted nucleic acid-binding protein